MAPALGHTHAMMVDVERMNSQTPTRLVGNSSTEVQTRLALTRVLRALTSSDSSASQNDPTTQVFFDQTDLHELECDPPFSTFWLQISRVRRLTLSLMELADHLQNLHFLSDDRLRATTFHLTHGRSYPYSSASRSYRTRKFYHQKPRVELRRFAGTDSTRFDDLPNLTASSPHFLRFFSYKH